MSTIPYKPVRERILEHIEFVFSKASFTFRYHGDIYSVADSQLREQIHNTAMNIFESYIEREVRAFGKNPRSIAGGIVYAAALYNNSYHMSGKEIAQLLGISTTSVTTWAKALKTMQRYNWYR